MLIYVLFFHVKQKFTISRCFNLILILGKIHDGGLDSRHCWWHHMPPAAPPPIKYTLSWREDQTLSTEGKIVSENSNISKILGRVPSTPVYPLYHGRSMNLRVRPSVNIKVLISRTIVKWWGTTRPAPLDWVGQPVLPRQRRKDKVSQSKLRQYPSAES